MTDAKNPNPANDVDWDEALAEWEGKSLAPEVAAEIPPEASPPERPASRRLYRPPSVPPAPLKAPPKVPRSPPIRSTEKGQRVDPAPLATSAASAGSSTARRDAPNREASPQLAGNEPATDVL